MLNSKTLLTLSAFALAVLTASAHNEEDHEREKIKFFALEKGNLLVNFTNLGARIVSLNVPDKFGNVADIVLGYDTIDAYQEDKYSFGAIVGRVGNRLDKSEEGGRIGLSNVIWKVVNHGKSDKLPFITFQYHSHEDEEGFPGNLVVTATYILYAKNKVQLSLGVEAKDEPASVNIAQNIFWNLGGHNSSGNVMRDHLRVLASRYRRMNKILPVQNTPCDFQQYHPIKSRIQKLKNGFQVEYVLDHQARRNEVELGAVLRDKMSGRVMKVWSNEGVLEFRTGDEVRNVRGKGGVLYQKNAGLVLSPQNGDAVVVTKQRPYNQTTLFQFLIKK